ncbi:MAG TPA: SRPBCC family protein [Burkholderiaceae bacterium]|nr:SRPBCC family protein [Burkholderiaceae bacterium]
MKFTHLIEINDPRNPLLEPLSHEQLWRGLVLRAEAPGLFMPHLDECTIFERNEEVMLRELRYGSVVIRDQVTLVPPQQVRYRVPAQHDIVASRLDMTIEEPQPGLLYVRFTYDEEDAGVEGEAEAMYNDFRRSAYEAADIDTISVIRELAANERFGPD